MGGVIYVEGDHVLNIIVVDRVSEGGEVPAEPRDGRVHNELKVVNQVRLDPVRATNHTNRPKVIVHVRTYNLIAMV